MTGKEKTELEGLREAITKIDEKVDRIDLKLARWDGAIGLLKFGGSLLGLGGIATVMAAILNLA